VQILTQELAGGRLRLWLPLLDGSERLGVVTVVADDPQATQRPELMARLRCLAVLAAELVMTKTLYGDTIVRLRRTAEMGLAAEMQWSLLPPLTFACDRVSIAGALEPAYQVAGDTVDYAVDAGCARVGVFDGMGHELQSAQLAALTVAAYRNARRSDRGLTDTVRTIDEALLAGFGGEAFTTAVIAELNTDTGHLEWVNAGHPEPLLLRDGKLVKTLHAEPAPPLGLGHSADPAGPADPVAVGSEQLQPGDRVLFYTDGVTEARSPDGDFFGPDRLIDLISRNLAGGLPHARDDAPGRPRLAHPPTGTAVRRRHPALARVAQRQRTGPAPHRPLTPARTHADTRRLSAGQPAPQQLLALLSALAALGLRLPEEVGELRIPLTLGVADVGLQPQHVAQAHLGEPDDVVVLVGGPGDRPAVAGRHHSSSTSW
jgi:hypothetical protein